MRMADTTSKPKNIHSSIEDIKKALGLDKIPNVHQPIPIKKDGKHLYKVAGYFYPLRPETIDRLKIPTQKILFEVDREQWHREMDEARQKENNGETIDPELYPWGFEG